MFIWLDITGVQKLGWSYPAPQHKFPSVGGGWKKFIETHNKKTGPVSNREHVAFIMMWLDHFIFGGSTIGPSSTIQCMAKDVVYDGPIPLGKYLLGATYNMLH